MKIQNSFIKQKKLLSFCLSVALLFSISAYPTIYAAAEEKKVYVSGEAIGVTLMNDGIIITDVVKVISDGKTFYPSANAGLRPGDVITSINGKKPENTVNLSEVVDESEGRTLSVTYRRENKEIKTEVKPVKETESGEYKIGLMVRDSASGIGTLTFVDPESNVYAALGHPINEVSSGKPFSILKGSIYKAVISGAKKGIVGEAGELEGSFSISFPVGTCTENNDLGIYGTLSADVFSDSYILMPIASQSEIQTGFAEIISTVDENGPQRYEIRITKVNKQQKPSAKGLVIEVTDERLIEKTGGIIQGMSGSPIIQNGKLVGAVTHVIVSNPKKGYGIFAEWMIEEALEEAA